MSDDYLDEDKKSGRLILLLFACLGGGYCLGRLL